MPTINSFDDLVKAYAVDPNKLKNTWKKDQTLRSRNNNLTEIYASKKNKQFFSLTAFSTRFKITVNGKEMTRGQWRAQKELNGANGALGLLQGKLRGREHLQDQILGDFKKLYGRDLANIKDLSRGDLWRLNKTVDAAIAKDDASIKKVKIINPTIEAERRAVGMVIDNFKARVDTTSGPGAKALSELQQLKQDLRDISRGSDPEDVKRMVSKRLKSSGIEQLGYRPAFKIMLEKSHNAVIRELNGKFWPAKQGYILHGVKAAIKMLDNQANELRSEINKLQSQIDALSHGNQRATHGIDQLKSNRDQLQAALDEIEKKARPKMIEYRSALSRLHIDAKSAGKLWDLIDGTLNSVDNKMNSASNALGRGRMLAYRPLPERFDDSINAAMNSYKKNTKRGLDYLAGLRRHRDLPMTLQRDGVTGLYTNKYKLEEDDPPQYAPKFTPPKYVDQPQGKYQYLVKAGNSKFAAKLEYEEYNPQDHPNLKFYIPVLTLKNSGVEVREPDKVLAAVHGTNRYNKVRRVYNKLVDLGVMTRSQMTGKWTYKFLDDDSISAGHKSQKPKSDSASKADKNDSNQSPVRRAGESENTPAIIEEEEEDQPQDVATNVPN